MSGQRWILLLAGLWFVLTFPSLQLPLFVIPSGQPLFLLLSGVYGLLQLLLGMSLQRAAQRRSVETEALFDGEPGLDEQGRGTLP